MPKLKEIVPSIPASLNTNQGVNKMTKQEMYEKAVTLSYNFRKFLQESAVSGVEVTPAEIQQEGYKMLQAISDCGPKFEEYMLLGSDDWFEVATRRLQLVDEQSI